MSGKPAGKKFTIHITQKRVHTNDLALNKKKLCTSYTPKKIGGKGCKGTSFLGAKALHIFSIFFFLKQEHF